LIDGNICRCTGYSNIVAAILDVSQGRKTCKFEDAKGV
jgi:aerobic-type carbon monoxide dehydrogenase small subunit (CoxS/CutS family)